MRKRFAGAALFIALAASAAHAQQAELAEPNDLPVTMRFAPLGAPDPRTQPGAGMFTGPRGVGLSRQSYTEQDGSQVTRRGLIANFSVARNVEAGVGLYSVTAEGRKPPETKRNWTVTDVTPRNRNIAALGMRVRF